MYMHISYSIQYCEGQLGNNVMSLLRWDAMNNAFLHKIKGFQIPLCNVNIVCNVNIF